MRIKKKSAIALSFAVGTMLFTTTALAEINSKSGYDQLKDAAKYTAESFTEKYSSYTTDISFVLKDNDKVVSSETAVSKIDVSNKITETVSKNVNGTKQQEFYNYRDKNAYISYNKDQDTYYVSEFTSPVEDHGYFKNPFKEKEAGDIEKIADALIGNLKDYVVVTENPDGSKELSGSLSEAQIPAIANALVSFRFKQEFSYRDPSNGGTMPRLTKDVFVKEVTGKAVINKDGSIESILGTGILYGKDEQDVEHNLTFELLGKVTNINSTSVNKPDLTGKKIEKTIAKNYENFANPQAYLGTYKSDIVIEKDSKFEKIGERIVDITQLDDKSVSGKYREEYKKGYESYASNTKAFEFSTKLEHFNGNFTATATSGKSYSGHISINPHMVNIYFGINESQSSNILYNGEYRRIFD